LKHITDEWDSLVKHEPGQENLNLKRGKILEEQVEYTIYANLAGASLLHLRLCETSKTCRTAGLTSGGSGGKGRLKVDNDTAKVRVITARLQAAPTPEPVLAAGVDVLEMRRPAEPEDEDFLSPLPSAVPASPKPPSPKPLSSKRLQGSTDGPLISLLSSDDFDKMDGRDEVSVEHTLPGAAERRKSKGVLFAPPQSPSATRKSYKTLASDLSLKDMEGAGGERDGDPAGYNRRRRKSSARAIQQWGEEGGPPTPEEQRGGIDDEGHINEGFTARRRRKSSFRGIQELREDGGLPMPAEYRGGMDDEARASEPRSPTSRRRRQSAQSKHIYQHSHSRRSQLEGTEQGGNQGDRPSSPKGRGTEVRPSEGNDEDLQAYDLDPVLVEEEGQEEGHALMSRRRSRRTSRRSNHEAASPTAAPARPYRVAE
jgi:hypothetical protein